jgi:site-specific DNA-adenine methylase
MTAKLTQPLKWHGGKGAFQGKLAAWIIDLMPPRCKNPNKPAPADPGWLHYCEAFYGGGRSSWPASRRAKRSSSVK